MAQTADQLYEQVLVLRCQTGDDGAFAELVGRYDQRLTYYVRRLAGPRRDPEDILQDVWLTVYRKLPQLRDPRALAVWLYRIARTTTLAALRVGRNWAELPQESVAPDKNGVEPVLSAEDAARIQAALDRLRPEHREVLALRFIEDMSYEQIAAVVGCPLGTVRSRLHHAKEALQRELGG